MLKSDCDGARDLAGAGSFLRGGIKWSDPIDDPKILSFSIPDLPKRDWGEFPNFGGAARGIKEALDGGGPAGVVETLLRKLRDLSGVDGESGSNGVLKLIFER